jgi:hypothetical protein
VLGGHFLREDLRIDTKGGPEGFPPIIMRSFQGWDRERKRYVVVTASNMGGVQANDMHFTDDRTIVTVNHSVRDGVPMLERGISKYDGDKATFTIETSQGAGPFFIMVEGKGKRSGSGYKLSDEDAKLSMAPAPEQMGRLLKGLGTYHMKGYYIMMPGAPRTAFSGTEATESLFGGNVILGHIVSDPSETPAYEGWSLAAWDSSKDCYYNCWFDNMGMFGESESRWDEDGKLVGTLASLAFGKPVVERWIVSYGEDGAPKRMVSDRITSVHEPARVFEGEYSKTKGGDEGK